MSTNKNPLRQLASAIVNATQAAGAKGVKQSVVLDVLIKNQGYRSIQASDAAANHAAPASTTAITAPDTLFAQGFFFSIYPDNDLFAVTLNEIGGRLLEGELAQRFGDTFFVSLWNLLSTNPYCFVAQLRKIGHAIGRIQDALDEDDDLAEVRAYLPDTFLSSVNIECRERDGSAYDTLSHISFLLETILDAIEANDFVLALMSQESASPFTEQVILVDLINPDVLLAKAE